ncbi:hypothetical protein BDW74DRAFT_180001 [Aspergillus multicolor]|uniref:uncharacterized protein n=1 Tax=Aspergillus multicolor TaxID=41759 RepID=UPI003CCCB063
MVLRLYHHHSLSMSRWGSLADGLYNCTANLYASTLDELVEAAVAIERQFQGREGVLLPPVSQEQQLSFSANVSEPFRWVASRQLLRDFSQDLVNYHVATSSNVPYGYRELYPNSHRFNQSLQAQLQRVGPTIGLAGTCWFYRATSVIDVSDDRQIRCYAGLGEANVTKCIRRGSGWENNPSSSASFIIQAPTSSRFDLGVSIYSTTSARYLSPDASSCVTDGSCDWDALFSDPPEPTYRNISASQQTYEYTMPGYTNDSAIWCDNTAFLSFAAYALSSSPVTNLLQLVQLGVLHDEPGSVDHNAVTISLHPDWTLAAWSANRRNGFVPGTRGSASRIIEAFQRFTFNPAEQALQFRLIHQNALMQAVSLIPYPTTSLTSSSERKTYGDQQEVNPYTSAILTSWATIQLWKYGIDSRTKVLGVVVLIMGMVVVVIITILWFEAPKSPTEIVVGALMHPPPPGAIRDEESGAPLTARLKYPGLEVKETTATAPATPAVSPDPTVRSKRHRRTSSFGFSHPASPLESPGPSPLSSPVVGTGAVAAAVSPNPAGA